MTHLPTITAGEGVRLGQTANGKLTREECALLAALPATPITPTLGRSEREIANNLHAMFGPLPAWKLNHGRQL